VNIQKNSSKDKEIGDLEKITKDEIYSDIWSRVIVKELETCRTYIYCKKEKLKNSSPNVEWFYELSAEDDPKDNLNKYLSDSECDYKYSNCDRRKIFHDNDGFSEFVLDGATWLYYKNKKHYVNIESLDGAYQESFILEYSESFRGLPIYERETYKSDYKYIKNLLDERRDRSIIVRNKNDSLVSILDENNPPNLFIDKFSDIIKRLFLVTLLIFSALVGGFIFLIPIYLLSLIFSPLILILLSLAYIFLGCKYLVLFEMAYPIEITSRIGDYIYRDKYELKPT
jgi:hypothetical protein